MATNHYCFHNPDRRADLVDTANALELGSGTGFIGVLVASLQLHASIPPFDRKIPSVYLTDVNSTVLLRCQNNVRLPCSKFGDTSF